MKISVILPAYNEEEIIEKNTIIVDDFLAKNFVNYELIIVTGGSTDKTEEIMYALAEKRPNIKVISYPFNRGKGAAVRIGALAAVGDEILFTDSDLAYEPKFLIDCHNALAEHDVAIGSRYVDYGKSKDRSRYALKRSLMSKVFIRYTNFILQTKFTDIQAGIKGFRKEFAKDAFSKLKIFGFGFDAEILALAKVGNFSIGEFRVEVTETRKSSKVRIIRDSILMFFNVLNIKWRILYYEEKV